MPGRRIPETCFQKGWHVHGQQFSAKYRSENDGCRFFMQQASSAWGIILLCAQQL